MPFSSPIFFSPGLYSPFPFLSMMLGGGSRFLLFLNPEGIRIPSLHSLHASFMKVGQGHRRWFPFLFSGSSNDDKVRCCLLAFSFFFTFRSYLIGFGCCLVFSVGELRENEDGIVWWLAVVFQIRGKSQLDKLHEQGQVKGSF
ncbi:PREDICTED: uncharacterized protein LOC109327865 isoform X2 [Lupinus angustifolius]|uniref:uncharacterized protein LOC109327865 isoform X2 n=1 Tax=Lupinus angustifolius TaxID=3871 RepID=UPI00092FD77C|nr:PREDICTED: uncharacterized protein LOC109327865 isoform X2 [Lupinus angustifolius]